MSHYEEKQKYESFRIPPRPEQRQDSSAVRSKGHKTIGQSDVYYEIEYDSSPIPGVGKFVKKVLSEIVKPPVRDEVRDRFDQMRDIARANRGFRFRSNSMYDAKVRKENAWIFYKQAVFMQDFEDNYGEKVTYSSYYPNYQMMGYQQLRTYFTWRSQIRKGIVTDNSLSYAFLYIYELLHNIGVAGPKEGLDQLMFFWQAYRKYNKGLDKYVIEWLKAYHVYYDLPHSFLDFTIQNGLKRHYPELEKDYGHLDTIFGIAKYNIFRSNFCTPDREEMIRGCLQFVVDRVETLFADNGMEFDSLFFHVGGQTVPWQPFASALFYPWKKQTDRQVAFSRKEVYCCANNSWTVRASIATESGKRLAGYIVKKTEAELRRITGYKYKITADINSVEHEGVAALAAKGIWLEEEIGRAVQAYYREFTKTVVTVDPKMLARIRREAWITQEKLTVEEEEPTIVGFTPVIPPAPQEVAEEEPAVRPAQQGLPGEGPAVFPVQQEALKQESASGHTQMGSMNDPWMDLKEALSEVEQKALHVLLTAPASIKQFADEQGVMLEVLMDGINEKAMDLVGDSLMDEEFVIYEDYEEQIRSMLEE